MNESSKSETKNATQVKFEEWAEEHKFLCEWDTEHKIYTNVYTQGAWMAYLQGGLDWAQAER